MVNTMVESLKEGIQRYPIISDQRFSIATLIVIFLISLIILWYIKRKKEKKKIYNTQNKYKGKLREEK